MRNIIILVLVLCATGNYCYGDVIVTTVDGRVRGIQMPGYQNGNFDAFMGIPFAEPPIAHRRFKDPEQASSSSGIIDATKPKPDCIQKNALLPNPIVTGSEDCLYLNVYRPTIININHRYHRHHQINLLPVIAFIHGGAYFCGSAGPDIIGPEYLMDTGEVILVTFAYRLGALGFLSTGDSASPGNFGLKDQTMALQWIKRNIESFGGNPDLVTLMGFSAGASSVHMHMMSPLSKGLFQKAISMSGNALGPYNIPTKDPLALAKKQASILNINATEPEEIIAALRLINATIIVDSIDELKIWSTDPMTLYRPVVEADGPTAFLIEEPAITSFNGSYRQIPWLQGFVQNEGGIRAAAILENKTLVDDLNSRMDTILLQILELEQNDVVLQKIKERYFNNSTTINRNPQGFVDLYSDISFLYPLYNSIENYLKNTNAIESKIFVYKFTYKGPFSMSQAITGTNTDFGVIHTDDTLFVFRMKLIADLYPKNSIYSRVIKEYVRFFTNFAKTGRPSAKKELKPCQEISRSKFCDYYEFTNGPNGDLVQKINNHFDFKLVKFWDDVYLNKFVK